MSTFIMKEIGKRLIDWYHENRRDLPWRETSDPYKIWLSEVILQQTRVAQGLSYYLKFVEHYPTVFDLASASEEEVLGHWKGLGYYARGRNLRKAAIQIIEEFNGKFPTSSNELEKIKGIGPYTAAAIASFAFKEQIPVVDGNVFRVLSRLFNDETPIDIPVGQKHYKSHAKTLLNTHPAHLYNQAIMEFGALQCTPKKALCNFCPIADMCEGRIGERWKLLPVKSKKIKKKNRYFLYFWDVKNGKTALTKRGKGDIWEGMFEMPLAELNNFDADLTELMQKHQLEAQGLLWETPKKHVLTHQNIYYNFIEGLPSSMVEEVKYYSIDEIDRLPLPRLLEKFIAQMP